MDMQEMKKQFVEAFPESAKLNEEELDQIVGGLRNGLSQEELLARLSGLGITKINKAKLGLLLDAKTAGGGLRPSSQSIT